jgi:hypothetical protein
VDEGASTALAPWITDWADPALQDAASVQLLRAVALPLLFPTTHAFSNVLVHGPPNCGKTYTLGKIREYVDQRSANTTKMQWRFYNNVQFPKEVDARLCGTTATHDNPLAVTVLVVDRVPAQLLLEWTRTDWWSAWVTYVHACPTLAWVVVCNTALDKRTAEQIVPLFPTAVHMAYPTATTVYHVLRQRICERFPRSHPFVRVPILDEAGALAHVAETFADGRNRGFDALANCLEKAIQMCNGLATQENVAYSMDGMAWFTRNSIMPTRLPDEIQYALMRRMQRESMACPARWWNVQLQHTLASTELDRISQVFAAEIEDATKAGVVAEVPLRTVHSPHFLRDGWETCAETLVSFHFSICRHVLTSIDTQKVQRVLDAAHTTLASTMLTPGNLAQLPPEAEHNWFDVAPGMLLRTMQGEGHRGVAHAETVLTCLESPDVTTTKSNPNSKSKSKSKSKSASKTPPQVTFQLRCGDQVSAQLSHTVHADKLRRTLETITDSGSGKYHVTQVQICNGYQYFIDYVGDADTPPTLHVSFDGAAGTIVVLSPRVQVMGGGTDLDESYRLTTEADVDLLTERFPTVYKDLFREDEATWKGLRVRDPAHLAQLNDKYSREAKFYLRLCSTMLRMKQLHYAALSSDARRALDDLLINVQNHLDYMLFLVPENEESGTWNEVWSMSKNHRLYARFHPPSHTDLDAVVENDLSSAWMKHGQSFSVPPTYLSLLLRLCAWNPSSSSSSSSSSLNTSATASLFQAWKHMQHATASSVASPTSVFLFAPSFAIRQNNEWSSACAISHMVKDDAAVQQCLREPSVMAQYISRTKKSLVHRLIAKDDLRVGFLPACEKHVHWYVPADEMNLTLRDILAMLRGHPDTWALLAETAHDPCELQWLFALCAASIEPTPTLSVVLAHLLMFRTWHYWTPETAFPLGLPHCVQRIMQRCTFATKDASSASAAFSADELPLFEVCKETPTTEYLKEEEDRRTTKHTLTTEQLRHVSMCGLRPHHVLDAVRNMI